MSNDTSGSISVEDYQIEKECKFEGERYLVRDNGAVFRRTQEGSRKRPNDEKWTFGKQNRQNPYLLMSNVRVHRIVATAFHGEPPDKKYVVDHIDGNCRNNRPENLRWLTRLENTLLNPVTRKKIEYLCGSVDAFLEDPGMLNRMNLSSDYSWMRRVTVEEAQACKVRMSLLLTNESRKRHQVSQNTGSFAKRALKPLHKWEADLAGEPGLDFAATPWCAQYMWYSNVKFPLCPDMFWAEPSFCYLENVAKGKVFATWDHDSNVFELKVEEATSVNPGYSFIVKCRTSFQKWALVGVTKNKKNHFIHFFLGVHENEEDAKTAFLKHRDEENWWSLAYSNAYSKWA